MNRLSLQDRAKILGCLIEGNSLAAANPACRPEACGVAYLLGI